MNPIPLPKSLNLSGLSPNERIERRILLDTGAVMKSENKKNQPIIATFLSKFSDHKINVSYVTRLEYFRGKNTKHQLETSLDRINQFNPIDVDKGTMQLASCYMYLLSNYLSENNEPLSILGGISVPDMIIGATALHLSAKVCTTNQSDFPTPFFHEMDCCTLADGTHLYMLRSDTASYDRMYKKHQSYLASVCSAS